ncbi:MAG: hypothetical protein DSY85_02465 [Marinomonas sp.]|nr:MAG: hypothetical protein DSY85_02465 [Marinomonas sp.]
MNLKHYIESRHTDSDTIRPLINPFSQQAFGSMPIASTDQIDTAISAAHRAFKGWSESTKAMRAIFKRHCRGLSSPPRGACKQYCRECW